MDLCPQPALADFKTSEGSVQGHKDVYSILSGAFSPWLFQQILYELWRECKLSSNRLSDVHRKHAKHGRITYVVCNSTIKLMP